MRVVKPVMTALLLASALAMLIQALLLVTDIVRYTKDAHEIVALSWMVQIGVSLSFVEFSIVYLMWRKPR